MKTADRLRATGLVLGLALIAGPARGASLDSGASAAENPVEIQASGTEALLNRILLNGKQQAAEAAYQLALAAAGRRDLQSADAFAMEATQLAPGNADYHQAAVHIAFAQKRFDTARIHQEKQLELVRARLGPGDSSVADLLDNLGIILMSSGGYDDAQQAFEQSLAIRRQALGPEHPDIALSYTRLANLAQKQDRADFAERYLYSAQAVLEAAFGASSPQVAAGLYNLGEFYRLHRRFGDAETAYGGAIRITERNPQINIGTLTASLNGMGKLFLVQGRLDDAQARFEAMRAHLVAAFGERHLHVAEADRVLELVEEARNRDDLSASLYRALAEELARATDSRASPADSPSRDGGGDGPALTRRPQDSTQAP